MEDDEAVSIRTAQTGANGIGVDEEATPSVDSSGAGAVAHTLRSEGFDASEDGTGRGTPLVAGGFMAGQGPKARGVGYEEGASPTLKSSESGSNRAPTIHTNRPIEDNICSFDPLPDSFRYAAMGDAVTVPVISWIGVRLAAAIDSLADAS